MHSPHGDYADTLLQRNEPLAVSSELGMRPLMERVLSRREILKAFALCRSPKPSPFRDT